MLLTDGSCQRLSVCLKPGNVCWESTSDQNLIPIVEPDAVMLILSLPIIFISFFLVYANVRYYLKGRSYSYVEGSEKTIQEEYGSSVAPDLDAADMELGTPNIVYLISGKDNNLYAKHFLSHFTS